MSKETIQAYLFFSGRCDEAIAFYQKALGAVLEMRMQFNETPDQPPPGMLEEGFEKKVMHASLKIGQSVLMLSDGCDSKAKFSGFKLSVFQETEADVHRVFAALSEGGEVVMPPTKTFWSPCFGMVNDKFGVQWMVTLAS